MQSAKSHFVLTTATVALLTVSSALCTCVGMDTGLEEDYAQYEGEQHLSNNLLEKAVSNLIVVLHVHIVVYGLLKSLKNSPCN